MTKLSFIYATTSGHTEYVVSVLKEYLQQKSPDLEVTMKRAEQCTEEDLMEPDVLVMGSGSWNTGGVEGQLDVRMYTFVHKTAKGVDLGGKKVGIIALGDDRYFYTCRSGEHIRNFINSHNGKVLGQPLLVVNEPYGQEERIHKWGDKFLSWLEEG